ncbi:MAG: DUF433 domain-containing protein [Chloroflexota bacterium]
MQESKIIETDLGPMISDTRMTIYDVMLIYDKGHDKHYISSNYNLTLEQVQCALDYIDTNRVQLEADLEEILPKMAESERYYQAIYAVRRQQIAKQPMTPKRAAFYALREKNRRAKIENSSYVIPNHHKLNHSQVDYATANNR